jgi:hypothetical protein
LPTLKKTSRVIATGSTAATATGTATATGSADCNCNLGFYEETLIFQTSNFEILDPGDRCAELRRVCWCSQNFENPTFTPSNLICGFLDWCFWFSGTSGTLVLPVLWFSGTL